MAATSIPTLQDSLDNNPSNMANAAMNAMAMRPNTGIPLLDAILSNSATTVASMTGNMDMRFIPTPGPGMNVREAYTSRDVMTPLARTMRDQAAYQFGAAFGTSLAGVGTAMGANKLFNMSPSQFERELVNAGTSPMGRAAMDFMMDQPAMQQMFGGNPMAAADMMFSQRNMLGNAPGGRLLNPYDVVGQTAYAAHASNYAQSLMRAAYSGPGGASGILNPNVTGSFNFNEFAYIGLRAAQEGMPGMRGLNVGGDQFTGGAVAMRRVLDAVKMNVGDMGTPQLFEQLARIEGPRWGRMNPQAMESNLYNLKAISSLTGGNAFGTAASISETFRAGGYEIGGQASTYLAQHIGGIQTALGGDINGITQRQTGLLYQNLESRSGGDAMAMEYIKQTMGGRPEVDRMYDNWRSANDFGTRADRANIAAQMYNSFAPGLEAALRDPVARRDFFAHALTAQSRANAIRTTMTGARTEYGEQIREGVRSSLQLQVANMASAAGLGFVDTTMAGQNAFLGGLDAIADKTPGLDAVRQNARIRLSATSDPAEKRRIMGDLLGSAALKDAAPHLRQQMSDAELADKAGRVFSTEGKEAFVLQGTITELMHTSGDPEMRKEIDKINYDKNLTPEGKAKAKAAYMAEWASKGEMESKLYGDAQNLMKRKVNEAENTFRGTERARTITNAMAVDPIAGQKDLEKMNLILTSGALDGDAAKAIRSSKVVNDAQKKELTDALNEKDPERRKQRLAPIREQFYSAVAQMATSDAGAAGKLGKTYDAIMESAAGMGQTAAVDKMKGAIAKADAGVQDHGSEAYLSDLQRITRNALGGTASEAVKGDAKGKGGSGGGGSGAGGPIKITGTLFLKDGKLEGTVN